MFGAVCWIYICYYSYFLHSVTVSCFGFFSIITLTRWEAEKIFGQPTLKILTKRQIKKFKILVEPRSLHYWSWCNFRLLPFDVFSTISMILSVILRSNIEQFLFSFWVSPSSILINHLPFSLYLIGWCQLCKSSLISIDLNFLIIQSRMDE